MTISVGEDNCWPEILFGRDVLILDIHWEKNPLVHYFFKLDLPNLVLF